ncbi:hypothetical protein EUTSA_v10028237mg, partial [Eutrema salsugineum]
MARLSDLPDDLLVKILSYLPTKVAVSTSVLSKRWQFLWMWLPNLEYSNSNDYSSRDYPESATLREIFDRMRSTTLREFVDKNLPLHRAPVIESLRLDLRYRSIKPAVLKRWVEISVSRNVRELEVSYDSKSKNIFPGSFYTCASLVILKLGFVNLMDVPSTGSLCSLKTLKLQYLEYANQGSLQRLLSICPVLEELSVHFSGEGECVKEFTIIVPSLRSLSLLIPNCGNIGGYVIDAPSLTYFKLEDRYAKEHYAKITNVPNLREAYVDVVSFNVKGLIRSITSVKRLTICSQ